MTNLANRRALDERLDVEVDHARRLGTNVAFVIADIDNFKSINDSYGHQTGDDVLRRVGRTFAEAVRELDLPGRYGGEEFAIVLPGTNLSGARALSEKIRKNLEELLVTTPDGTPFQVTASFGAACLPGAGRRRRARRGGRRRALRSKEDGQEPRRHGDGEAEVPRPGGCRRRTRASLSIPSPNSRGTRGL